jgi:hypothetical protein
MVDLASIILTPPTAGDLWHRPLHSPGLLARPLGLQQDTLTVDCGGLRFSQ